MTQAFSPLRLYEAAGLLDGEVTGADVAFTAVSTDSRQLSAGALFVALTGPNFDGHDFVAVARERGAVAALVSRPVADPLPQLRGGRYPAGAGPTGGGVAFPLHRPADRSDRQQR